MKDPKLCSHGKCERLARRQGLCQQHYDNLPAHLRGYVDAAPALAHVMKLRELGWSWDRLAKDGGVCNSPLILQRKRLQARKAYGILSIPLPDEVCSNGALTVPNVGPRRRVRALAAIGYSQYELADMMNMDQRNLSREIGEHKDTTSPLLAAKIARLFRELQATPGANARARKLAQSRGWPPPFCWDEDEIDNPLAKPTRMRPETKHSPDWYVEYRELKELGITNDEAAKRMGIARSTLHKRLERLRAA